MDKSQPSREDVTYHIPSKGCDNGRCSIRLSLDNSFLVPQRTRMLPITTCPPWPDVLGGLPWRDVGRLAAPTASNLLCGNQDPALRPQAGQSPRPRGLKGRPSDHVAGQSPREPGLYLPGEPGHSCAAPRCQPARRHSVAAKALHGVGPPCGATLWTTLNLA